MILLCSLLLGSAIYNDLRRHRIPNRLTVPAGLVGILYHSWCKGLTGGLLFSLSGLTIGFAILLIPFLLGGLGGGDVKLFAALGSFLGPRGVFSLFLYGALAGGVIVLAMVFRKNGLKGIKLIFWSAFLDLSARQKPRIDTSYQGLPYAVPMAAGYVSYLFMGPIV